jgi:autotransporter translocation and assembly factor TamB
MHPLLSCKFNIGLDKFEVLNRDTGGGQNNGNTKKLRDRIYVGYIERASAGNTECSSVLHSVVLVPVY